MWQKIASETAALPGSRTRGENFTPTGEAPGVSTLFVDVRKAIEVVGVKKLFILPFSASQD